MEAAGQAMFTKIGLRYVANSDGRNFPRETMLVGSSGRTWLISRDPSIFKLF